MLDASASLEDRGWTEMTLAGEGCSVQASGTFFADLTPGFHHMNVRGVDELGNVGPPWRYNFEAKEKTPAQQIEDLMAKVGGTRNYWRCCGRRVRALKMGDPKQPQPNLRH